MHIPFCDDMIDLKTFDPNKIKIDEKLYENILIYCIEHVTTKNSRYAKINSANPLYLSINKINGHIEDSIGKIFDAISY